MGAQNSKQLDLNEDGCGWGTACKGSGGGRGMTGGEQRRPENAEGAALHFPPLVIPPPLLRLLSSRRLTTVKGNLERLSDFTLS